MTTILTYGTFDTLHYGHINLLRRAKALGDYLIVGLSTDAFNTLKGKKSHFNYAERETYLEAITYVDLIIPENSWAQKPRDLKAYSVDIFTMGADWEGEFDHLTVHCPVQYLTRTAEISSTLIKSNIGKLAPHTDT